MSKVSLFNNDGSSFDLPTYLSGKNLLLVFFRGAWCNICKKQLKEIQSSLDQIEALNTKVVAISSDNKLNSSLLKAFLQLSYPVLSDNNFALIDQFDLRTKYQDKEVSKPAVLIFDSNGSELYRFVGENYDDRIATDKLILDLSKL